MKWSIQSLKSCHFNDLKMNRIEQSAANQFRFEAKRDEK